MVIPVMQSQCPTVIIQAYPEGPTVVIPLILANEFCGSIPEVFDLKVLRKQS